MANEADGLDLSKVPSEVLQSANAEMLRNTAFKQLAALMTMGLGVGAGSRGLLGLYNMAHSNISPPSLKVPKPIVMDIPVKRKPLQKRANPVPTPDTFTDPLKKWFAGHYAEDTSGIPWAAPAMIGGTTAATYGGWKLIDWLLGKRHKADLQTDLTDAEQDYERTLRGVPGKTAELSTALEDLFDLISSNEKQASSWGHTLGQAAGMYGSVAMLPALVVAKMMYDVTKKRSPSELLRKAVKKYENAQAQIRPVPVFARPVDVDNSDEDVTAQDV